MIKRLMLLFFTIITSNFLFAQQNNLQVKGQGADLYIEHNVVPKESFYSIGRLYNVSPRDLAAYNHLQLESGLSIGQNLKIPLNKNNFTQTGKVESGEVLVPVLHTVVKGETLYRLGFNYNKVPLGSLKKWNHLSSDALNTGDDMIVGYLKVDKNQSALAKGGTTIAAVASVSQNKPNVTQPKPETPAATASVKEPPLAKPTDNSTFAGEQDDNKILAASVKANSDNDFGGGYFRNLYNDQTENKRPVTNSGSAGVFKSTSGWQDGKYYCFNNNASPGTILKVTDNATGKSVYAKVLDGIPDIKQNDGLLIVISNAAAEELGTGANEFNCVISFAK